jgi:hypothetical protein
MKRTVVAALLVMSMVVTGVRAQDKPAADAAVQPAATPAAAPATAPATPAAVPTAQPAAVAGEELRQQIMELMKQVNALEREARKNDPTLNAKLDDLEKQRRQIFIQAKPEIEALYAQQDVVQDKAKALWGKNAGQAGKTRQGGGDARAEKKAERATQRAEKAAEKAQK